MRLQSKLSRYVLVVGLNRMHRRDDTQEKGTARWLLSRKLFGVLTKGNGHLESKRLEGRVCLRDADITTKISFIGRTRLVKEVGSFLNKLVVFGGARQVVNRTPLYQNGDYAGSRKRSEASPAEWSTGTSGERSDRCSIRGCAEGSSARRVCTSVGPPNRRSAHRRTGTADGRASTHRAFHCPAHP